MTTQNETKTDRPTRSIQERFLVLENGTPRPLTDADEAVDGKVYAILPRYADSKATPEEVAATCRVTNTRFIALTVPMKQKDGSWKAELTTHPVILRRYLMAKERRESAVKLITARHGEGMAALWTVKR